MQMRTLIVAMALATGMVSAQAEPPPAAARGVGVIYADGALMNAVRSPDRSPQNLARDRYRHPRESLSFWGLEPGMMVLEIWPGGGYWTEILAPYAKATGGKYFAAVPNEKRALPDRFSNKSLYGDISITTFNEKS